MVLELALDSGATILAYRSGSLLFRLAKTNWYRSQDFRRLFWTKKRWEKEYADFRERVIQLEMDTGVGLSNDSKEWISAKVSNFKIRAHESYLQNLAVHDHNGHVEVHCNLCDALYVPCKKYKDFYGDNTKDRAIKQCLCPPCKNKYEEILRACPS